MTIEGQLRELARHIDEHQPVITATEIVLRASGQPPKPTSLDDASHVTSPPHDRIARGRCGIRINGGDAHVRHAADSEHKTRWRIPAVAAAAIVVVGVGAIVFAVSNTNADDDGVSQAPAPTAHPPQRRRPPPSHPAS